MTGTQRAVLIALVVVCAALATLALAFIWWLINSALTAVLPVILTL
ncbi:hypothetical protein ODZ83_11025 [Acaricomes phytoseiuli]|nr:hypothetical protein [Acaricomes phytoseiuli]MCW1250694.1 hypothetical protein [Acaricomes phytoseiuli]